ncbi:hypothetical protein [Paractinoplanes maris]|uniref:hypothetical protein n=1 Tax=Paractinoplanes maris TaxID=1734446 RepID=UPI00201FED9D|nr:hypothetical protein [Actinoplanes maris]
MTTNGETPAEPASDFGPATPGTSSSRISFGFTPGPISPVRHPASPTSPAAPAAPPAAAASPPAPPAKTASAEPTWPTSAAESTWPTAASEPAWPTAASGASEPGWRSSGAAESGWPAASAGPAQPVPTGTTPSDLPIRRAGGNTGEQRRITDTGEQVRLGSTGEQRRLGNTGEQRDFGNTGGQRRFGTAAEPGPVADTGEQVRLGSTGEQRRLGNTGEQRDFGNTGGQRRFGTAAEPGPVADTGEQVRLGSTGEQRRFSTAGEQRSVADTGEFRRFLNADEERALAETADRRAAAPPARAAVIADPPRQSRAVTVGIVLLSLVVLIAGGIVGVLYFTGTDDELDSVLQLGAGESGKRTVSAPLDNRSQAAFEMLAATNRVNLSIGELGDDLFRISTPEDAGFLPSPTLRNDDVKLQVTKDGDGTGGVIDVVLAAKVRWSVRLSGYAEENILDLSGGQVSGVEMVGGMRTGQLTLARPDGTVPIKVNGAVEKLVVRSPAGSPVRVKVGGGAKTVVAGTRTLRDVVPGSTLTPKNWAVANRYDVGAGAPITALTVENG